MAEKQNKQVAVVREVLEVLRRQRGQWVAVEALAAGGGGDVRKVQAVMAALEGAGYAIESAPRLGYRLVGHGALTSELVELGLQTQRVGRRVLVYESTASTNDVAWGYAMESGWDGLAVFAREQTAGRGRLGRRWESPKGMGLLCSVLLQEANGLTGSMLSLLAGVAAAEAVEEMAGRRARIQWPNDVVVEGRKVAGTMVEGRGVAGGAQYVVGVGINCRQGREDFPAELCASATSLAMVSGGAVDMVHVAQELLRSLDRWQSWARADRVEDMHEAWSARCDDIGRRIAVVQDGRRYEGRVIDVSAEGGLLVQLDSGGARFFDAATTTVEKG